jgi:methanogenic corrinoid protein MtbC1
MPRDWSGDLVEMIRGADRLSATVLVDEWIQEKSPDALVDELLAPALEHFGRLWADSGGDTSLAQGYVASKVAEDILGRILEIKKAKGEAASTSKGPVVLGNIEDDYHPLGRKMVVSFLRSAGWEVYDLGVDVVAEAFVDKATEVGARVIGASAMMYSTARNIARLREEIDRRGLRGKLQLAVGGAVFKLRPELVAELGGDGTCNSALEAPLLFDDLWKKSCVLEASAG